MITITCITKGRGEKSAKNAGEKKSIPAFAQDIVLGDEAPSATDESFSETRSPPLELRVKSHGLAVALTAVMPVKFLPDPSLPFK